MDLLMKQNLFAVFRYLYELYFNKPVYIQHAAYGHKDVHIQTR